MSELNQMVRDAFFAIMFALIAYILYAIFFGQGAWEGALWYGARMVERPIANYYYSYTYVPNVHSGDYLDIELGCKVFGHDDVGDITASQLYITDPSLASHTTYPAVHYTKGWE